MRFEKLIWLVMVFALSSAAWEEKSISGAIGGNREYQATDGASEIPPPDGP